MLLIIIIISIINPYNQFLISSLIFSNNLKYLVLKYNAKLRKSDGCHDKFNAGFYLTHSGVGGVHTIKQNKQRKKLQGFSPQANYTDRATAACRRR
jgi:hypothetical protein